VNGRPSRRRPRVAGVSVIELLASVAVCGVLMAMAAPRLTSGRDEHLARRAARHLAAVLGHARSLAVAGDRHVGVRFSAGAHAGWDILADGNRNGIRSADAARGIDWPIVPGEVLAAVAPGVSFGILDTTTDVDDGAPLDGPPIKVPGQIVSFNPGGSASSGTVYLAGPGRRQYAVRVLGSTGRIRVLRFDPARLEWTQPY